MRDARCFSVIESDKTPSRVWHATWKVYSNRSMLWHNRLICAVSRFLQVKGSFVGGQNNSKYRDCAALSFFILVTAWKCIDIVRT